MAVLTKPCGAWLTVNKACNFRCGWCYAQGTEYVDKSMDLDLGRKLTLLLRSIDIDLVLLIGGEPTLWPNLLRFNAFCRDTGVRTSIVTNAMRFGDDKFWQKYLESPNSSAGVSVKAGSKEELFRVAGVNNFKTARIGLERACSYFNCGVGITYNSYYADTIIDVTRFALDCGAKSVKIDFCTPAFAGDRVDDRFMVEPREIVRRFIRDYAELDAITNGQLVFHVSMPLCLWPRDFIAMLKEKQQITTGCQVTKREGIIFDVGGELIVCNGLFDYPIGRYPQDFIDRDSLLSHLNSPEVNRVYDGLASYPLEKCRDCDMYPDCGGGCPLKWAVYNPADLIP